MDTSTVNQLIQSGTILLLGLAGIISFWRATKSRRVISREKDLLLDCYFYRRLIDKYKDRVAEQGDGNLYHTFRDEVEDEIGFKNSRHSGIGAIESRLVLLAQSDDELAELISRLKLI